MLKLLKYELIGSYRQYLTTFVIYIILCCATPFLPAFLSEIISGLLIAALFGIIITVYVNIITHYARSMFSRSGYLTLTLPVSTSELVLSKLIGAMIWSTVAFFILGAGMFLLVLFVSGASINEVWQLVNMICYQLSLNLGIFFQILVSLIIGTLFSIVSLYFVITFVNTKYVTKNRILIGILIYVAGSLLFNLVANSSIITNILDSFNPTQYLILVDLLGIIGIVGFFFGITYLIDKKLQIE